MPGGFADKYLYLALEGQVGTNAITCKVTLPNGKKLGGGNLFSINGNGTISRMGGVSGAVAEYGIRLNRRSKVMMVEEIGR